MSINIKAYLNKDHLMNFIADYIADNYDLEDIVDEAVQNAITSCYSIQEKIDSVVEEHLETLQDEVEEVLENIIKDATIEAIENIW